MYAEVDSGWLIHSYCNTDPVMTTSCKSLTPTYTAVLCDLAALPHVHKSHLMTYANALFWAINKKYRFKKIYIDFFLNLFI